MTEKNVDTLSFEEALSELEGIVRSLESGQGKLDEAISAYERGELLKAHCEKKLKEAQDKIEKIKISADGSLSAEKVEVA